ncbi:3-hydroxyacyl-ACP dehydratase [Sulfurospirillum barnesii]|uniref:3-hydroxymyristoyl/3-hydroxydecanoyl-(Acyl carrier protein) dehydratase n=1 Tax=Sulfurospirillum barnesii (strain ATCC 700032 / DSM 10660 / SES-3) TaxID=760154 RepID=I3XZY9_SULBS|nr:3-hydroxyacyl-ACP dehydratase [Sulfurospirillum barnesii]AFL69513.1 3-hydroxymyristoyl/3-hydroxydecanoyl-(acyl carrier protein) dehydratase [Sulfurospirillum barnesii SES-3]
MKDNTILTNLYTPITLEPHQLSVTLSDAHHPIFQAHFPNNPLLPGFVLLDMSAQLLHVKIKRIQKAKFLKPILPKTTLFFDVTCNEKKVKITVKNSNEKVAELIYETE